MTEGDRQQEKVRELRKEINKATEALAKERTKAVNMASTLEEAARNRMELT